jgi:hypothetical protein
VKLARLFPAISDEAFGAGFTSGLSAQIRIIRLA